MHTCQEWFSSWWIQDLVMCNPGALSTMPTVGLSISFQGTVLDDVSHGEGIWSHTGKGIEWFILLALNLSGPPIGLSSHSVKSPTVARISRKAALRGFCLDDSLCIFLPEDDPWNLCEAPQGSPLRPGSLGQPARIFCLNFWSHLRPEWSRKWVTAAKVLWVHEGGVCGGLWWHIWVFWQHMCKYSDGASLW